MKFNLKAIMSKAWSIVKEKGYSMSVALRAAWYEAKNGIKAYAIHIEERRQKVAAYIDYLRTIIEGGTANEHEVHKYDILRAALEAPAKDGLAIVDGKTAGLIKYAERHAA